MRALHDPRDLISMLRGDSNQSGSFSPGLALESAGGQKLRDEAVVMSDRQAGEFRGLDQRGQVDMTDRYNTELSPADETAFQKWAKANKRDRDLADYDMRGAWLAGERGDGNGHFPDTYKKPSHPTFSTDSKYHGVDGNLGGVWGSRPDGKDTFTPSRTNIEHWPGERLRRYFEKYEPGGVVTPEQVPDARVQAWLVGLGARYDKARPPSAEDGWQGWDPRRGEAPKEWLTRIEGYEEYKGKAP